MRQAQLIRLPRQGFPGHRGDRTGFTLIELILVILLISLALGLSSLIFAGTLSTSRLNATAREISAAVKHARALTLMMGERHTVIIDLDAREYELAGRGSKKLPADIAIRVIDPVSGDVRQGRYEIICHPGGFIEGGTVEISNSKKTLRIELDPVLGSVSIRS